MTGIIAQNVGRTSGLIKAASGGGGAWTKIKTLTASDDSDLSFVDGTDDVVLDSTYPIYVFKTINLFSHTDDRSILFNFTTDGTNWDVTKTTTYFRARHNETDAQAGLDYRTRADLAQSANGQEHLESSDGAADANANSTLYLFNPSSTTFVKHFLMEVQGTGNGATDAQMSTHAFIAGYCNTTSAVTGFQLVGNNTNISATVKLYGIKDS